MKYTLFITIICSFGITYGGLNPDFKMTLCRSEKSKLFIKIKNNQSTTIFTIIENEFCGLKYYDTFVLKNTGDSSVHGHSTHTQIGKELFRFMKCYGIGIEVCIKKNNFTRPMTDEASKIYEICKKCDAFNTGFGVDLINISSYMDKKLN